jgi:hypothetical protein
MVLGGSRASGSVLATWCRIVARCGAAAFLGGTHERRDLVLAGVVLRLPRLGRVPAVARMARGEAMTPRRAAIGLALLLALTVVGVLDASWLIGALIPLGTTR